MSISIVIQIILTFVSFYNLQFQDIDNNTISMNSFQGKKVLLVNIGSNSDKISQLGGLQYLHEQHQDSLVIIIFPSNSFGNEPKTNEEIKQFCLTNYHSQFIIAAKSAVKGPDKNSIYSWLANQNENGDISVDIFSDFQKVFIDSSGHISAILSPKIKPLDPRTAQAITSVH